jgi:uracil-DNA glycosylase family 4
MLKERTEALREIRDSVVNLTRSPLYAERIKNGVHPVIGEGSHWANLMFVGEAPGRTEAATGRPFVGAAGKILNELLAAVEIDRANVYITNIVKDRPPFNRDPLPEEIDAYGPFLDAQINIIQPTVIATLGRYAMGYIMTKFELGHQLKPISAMHGRTFVAQAAYGPITIVPLYHPAVAVYNRNTKDTLLKDFQVLRSLNCAEPQK